VCTGKQKNCQKFGVKSSEILFVFLLVSKTLFTGVDPILDSFLPYGAMNFIPALGIRFRTANSCTRRREIFTGLSQDGGRADFSKSLRASLFNKYQSNEPNFSRIHLAGQFKWVLIVTDEKRVTVNTCKLL
jgi:hypothetical protein